MYFGSLILFYALGLHKGLTPKPTSKWIRVVIPLVGSGLVAGILLATPYRNARSFKPVTDHGKVKPLHVVLTLKKGPITVVAVDEFTIKGKTWGYGVPTSAIAVSFAQIDQGDYTSVVYAERLSGRFTKADQDLTISLPWNRIRKLSTDASDSEVKIVLPGEFDGSKNITVSNGNGNVIVGKIQPEFGWQDGVDRKKFGQLSDSLQKGNPMLDVLKTFEGDLILSR